MVGGDTARLEFACASSAHLTVTTQSAEKIYRAEHASTAVEVDLEVAPGAQMEWLPQETILFDRARLRRQLDVAMAADASVLLCEMIVFGRLAMQETVHQGALHDRWRVVRDRRLIFAEDFRLSGSMAETFARPALGGGARAIATLLYAAPDAEARLDAVRAVLADGPAEAAASAWNGFLSVRACSPSPERVRAAIVGILETLRGRPAPRVWQ